MKTMANDGYPMNYKKQAEWLEHENAALKQRIALMTDAAEQHLETLLHTATPGDPVAAQAAVPDAQAIASAIRQRILSLSRSSFLSPAGGGVQRVPDRSGKWIELDAAAALCEPENVDAMLAAAPAPMPAASGGWVAVSDRLPDEQDRYLGMLREDNPLGFDWKKPVEVAFDYLPGNRKRFSVFDAWTHENVDIQDHMTHWMPLPDAPRREGGVE